MFTEISTSTMMPLPISSRRIVGSCSSPPCRLRRGFSTVAATISSSNIQRTMSISCTAVSVIAESLS
jgi:hypothetical protein